MRGQERDVVVAGGHGPLHGSTVKTARSNAARPRSRASFSIIAPVPPGYGWNCSAGASPLPSGTGGGGGLRRALRASAGRRPRAPGPARRRGRIVPAAVAAERQREKRAAVDAPAAALAAWYVAPMGSDSITGSDPIQASSVESMASNPIDGSSAGVSIRFVTCFLHARPGASIALLCIGREGIAPDIRQSEARRVRVALKPVGGRPGALNRMPRAPGWLRNGTYHAPSAAASGAPLLQVSSWSSSSRVMATRS